MALSPVSSSSAAVTTTEAARPQQNVRETPRSGDDVKNEGNAGVNGADNATQAAPRPTVNTNGQTIGTRVNITA